MKNKMKIHIGSNNNNLAKDFIEIDSTFERLSPINYYKKIINSNPNKKFIIKANKEITHFNFIKNLSFVDSQEEIILDKKGPSSILLHKFKQICDLFNDKLLFILFKFPYGFKNTFQNREFLFKLNKIFNTPIAFEFENKEFENYYNEFNQLNIIIVNKNSNICGNFIQNLDIHNMNYKTNLNNLYLMINSQEELNIATKIIEKYKNQSTISNF
ncbi:DUF72 domain-containing protein [Candidatus Woesearchaeota archaeon]|jgi:uncharacterized protein YecE (DUF72 family)|nr:DUF72 domain-containing protein [Candidatus Woesearchaeota archaeon]